MPSNPPKKTRKRLTIKEKVELIELSLKGFKNVDLSRKFDVAELLGNLLRVSSIVFIYLIRIFFLLFEIRKISI